MSRSAPPPGQAVLPATDAAALLRRNGTDPAVAGRPAIRLGDHVWTHAEALAEAERWGRLFMAHRPPTGGRPTHVGVLLDNVPEYLFALSGAALSGSVIVGLNHTRVGEHLRRDIEHTEVDLVITEPRHVGSLSADVVGDRTVLVVGAGLEYALDDSGGAAGRDSLPARVDVDSTWMLIFTSGTSGAPKAVICSQRRLLTTGARMVELMGLSAADVGYVAMPLFHSNALMVGWAPSVVIGASVALAPRFSASGFLPDVRRYGATWFNYTGKPLAYVLATPEQPDDADNLLRVAFGNEGSPAVVEEFGRRFGVEVIDAFGSTEGAIAVNRDVEPRRGAVGVAPETVLVVDADDRPCPPARYDSGGALVNAEACVGEIVNTAGAGPFEGYYGNDDATAAATRGGWYRSGDLGYLDTDRYLFFAGRTAEWIRVDGENFPAGPIGDAISSHADVVVAVAYGVPDPQAGDQVMAAIVVRPGTGFDGAAFASWLESGSGMGSKWWPRFVRVAEVLPTTGTNKVVTRRLQHDKFRLDAIDGDELWVRGRGDAAYRRFGPQDQDALRAEFDANDRLRFWDL